MKTISIRDLQKISAAAIEALPGPVPVRSGDQTVAILTPVKQPDLKRLRAWAKKTELLRQRRNAGEDREFLSANPDVEDWSQIGAKHSQKKHPRTKIA